MIRLFFKQQKSNITEKGQNKIKSKTLNNAAWRRKLTFVVVMILVLSFGGSVQAYAASDAYAYEILDRVSAKSEYPSIQGLALGDGQAYVLKTTGASGTECVFFAGKKTNLIKINENLGVGHGNDMTYNKWDKKLYVAPRKDKDDKKMYIYRMTTEGEVDAKIKTDYMVGGIACWLNYDKDNKSMSKRAAFVLKDTDDLFHIVQINGTKLKELAKFKVNIAEKEKLNQGICMYDGYLYVTYANSQNGNSYVYRVDKK